MKIHSYVDVITNSSSTAYISAPNAAKLTEQAKQFGFASLEVRLSRKEFASTLIRYRYDILDHLELSEGFLEDTPEDELYDMINKAFVDGKLVFSYETDPYYEDVEIVNETAVEIIAVLPDGKTINLSDLFKAILG